MKNLIMILLVVTVGAILSGCATADAVLIDTSRRYPPTESVVILLEEPGRPYEVIAILEGNGSQFNNQSQVIKAIQKKARKIGAHAVYLISSGSQYVPPTYTRNIDGSLLTIPGGNKQMVKAIAIRFTKNYADEPRETKYNSTKTVLPRFRKAAPEFNKYSDEEIITAYRKRYPELRNAPDKEIIRILEQKYGKK